MSISRRDLREVLDVQTQKGQDGEPHIFIVKCTGCEHLCELTFFHQKRFTYAALDRLGVVFFSLCKKLEKEEAVMDERGRDGQLLLTWPVVEDDEI